MGGTVKEPAQNRTSRSRIGANAGRLNLRDPGDAELLEEMVRQNPERFDRGNLRLAFSYSKGFSIDEPVRVKPEPIHDLEVARPAILVS